MREYRIQIKKEIMSSLFIGQEQTKGVIVIAPGLPQYIQKDHRIIQEASALGYAVLIVKYPGSWESLGEFTVENSTYALEQAVELATKGSAKELYANMEITWPTNHIIVIGYSYGALPTMLASYPDNIKTLLVCPFLSTKLQKEGENIDDTLSFLERAYPNVYTFSKESLLAEMSEPKLLTVKKIPYVIRGEHDTGITDETYQYLKDNYNSTIVVLPIGHSLVFNKDIESTLFLNND